MQAIKDFATVIGAVIGVMTALVTLYAKFLDLRKKATQKEEDKAAAEAEVEASLPAPTPRPKPPRAVRVVPAEEFEEPPAVLRVIEPSGMPVDRVRELVKAPAIALMVAGGISLIFNLLVGGYGYVDTFVTPLSPDSKAHQAAGTGADDRATNMMTIVVTLGLSVASAAAGWAGYNMLRLRSYWLSMAGSVAIMPGACLFCFAGMPVGIWSVTVLLKPEVRAAFH